MEIKVGDIVSRREKEPGKAHAESEVVGTVRVLEVREETTSSNGDKGMKCKFEAVTGDIRGTVGDLYFKDVVGQASAQSVVAQPKRGYSISESEYVHALETVIKHLL